MRFAISIPDATFERVSQRAALLGISRSEFFSRAAERYVTDLDQQAMVDRIDAAIATAEAGDNSARDAVAAGRQTLRTVDGDR